MKLSTLIRSLKVKINKDIEIQHLTADSRTVTPSSLYVAVPGFVCDGHQYINDVVKKGIKAVVVQKKQDISPDIIQIIVPDTREALALLSCEFFGHPTKNLVLVGVTGTNGKTTSTYILESIFKEAGFNPGVIGTVNYRYGGKEIPAPNTTPESLDFQKMLYDMKKEGVGHVVMEVSSHALKLKRVDGSHFNVGLFTNLTQDHLDFHKDFNDYFSSKKRLFLDLLKHSQKKMPTSIINIDDPYGVKLYEELKKNKQVAQCFTTHSTGADIVVKSFEFNLEGLKAEIKVGEKIFSIRSQLLGEHNLSNIIVVIGVASALGISQKIIEQGVWNLKRVPGRLERVDAGQPYLVLVDYAHTDDALKNVGQALQKLKKNRIITVFGCGGDRDRKKRPLMAKAAENFSNQVIVTSDNPRTEEPQKIIEEILGGFTQKNYSVEIDRKRAIQKAIALAKPKDIILIAGKGHEDYQILGKTKIHFDDREVAHEAICLQLKKS